MKRFNALPPVFLVSLALLGLAAWAQSPVAAPDIKPIESLWFASTRHFPGTSEVNAVLEKGLKDWQQAKAFDAFLLMKFPPTFADEREFNRRANALIKEVGGRFIVSTLTVGTEGWQSSANQRFAKQLATAGAHYDAGKAMSQTQWLETMQDLDADTWAWALEQPAHMPTPEEAAQSASEFVRFAKAHHKRTVIWLSAEAFRYPGPETGMLDKMVKLEQRICEATRDDADFFVWMDLPGATLQAGESQWRETMGHLLDRILTMTPKEKTVIQWLNHPKWPTKDVEGTKLYISACQAKGINRFCLLSSFGPAAQSLDHDPFREFYRTLPKVRTAATTMAAAKAQDNNQPRSADGEARNEQRMNEMIEELGLTADAKQKFKTILQEQFAKTREIIQQSNGDREKALPEITKMREETLKKLKEQGILNDEQIAKYRQMGPPTAAGAGEPAGRTTVEFPRGTGHRWMVNGAGRVDQRRGPGNNYWSNAPDMVWVDEKGLHLKIVKRGDQWRCSALGLPEGLGYGKYIFSLATRVDRLDRNVVIGLFTFNNETFKTDANGELDVEITSWGKDTPHPMIDYTVQPARDGHFERGHQVDPTSAERTTHVIEWTPRYVEFHSYEGDGETGKEIGHFRFDDTNPPSRIRNPVTGEESDPVVVPNPHNKAHAAINLWLVKGQPPTNAEEIEIVVSDFRFVPLPK
jgi:hypothetical protein